MGGRIALIQETAKSYGVEPGDSLLVIRGSDIAFDFAVKGLLVERVKDRPEIPVYH